METEQEAIIREVQAFSEAWSHGDAKAAASFYTDDGIRVGAAGDMQQGRSELEAAYNQLFHGPFEGAKVVQERGMVRLLTPEFATWRGGLRIEMPDGRVLEGHVVQIMKKTAGRWLVLEGHPKLYPPPPSQ